ncbi:unnamed protein product [Effrenium voratum]|uniref:Uncharacterized protein n=1 Tax=Effrenium voratum TaxID=2562239 RepID=A0AA36IC61_9DINO|nr:unnamed protein product [Effrenium voratum]
MSKPRLPAAALRRQDFEAEDECCVDTFCSGRRCFQILAAAHTTGGLVAISMISAIIDAQLSQQSRIWGFPSSGIHALGGFAILPLLGQLLSKADSGDASRIIAGVAFICGLLVALALPVMFIAGNGSLVPDVCCLASLLLGACEASVRLVLLNEVQATSLHLTQSLGVAFFLSFLGRALGSAVANTPWGTNGYFVGVNSKRCPTGSTCMRVQVCMLLALPFQLLGLCLAMRLRSEKKRWRSRTPKDLAVESHNKEKEDIEMEELLQDPGTVIALVGALLCSISSSCAEEQSRRFAGGDWVGLALAACFLSCCFVRSWVRCLGGFGTWMVAALLNSFLLLLVPAVADWQRPFWVALAAGLLPLVLVTLPAVVAIRRTRARQRPPCVALALVLALQEGGQVLWTLAGPLFALGLVASTGLGSVCSAYVAVLCSRAIVCDRDGDKKRARAPRASEV